MVPNHLVVREDDTVMTAAVIETYEHRNFTAAKVEVNPFDPRTERTEFVEVPDSPETPVYALECRDCGHEEEQPDGRTKRVGDKHNRCQHRGSAELLKQIHEAKTGHDATVNVQPA